MLRVLTIVGTRPEAIKLAPVIHALRADPARFQVRVCATAQQREMLDQAFVPFGITPDADLDLMRPQQGLADLTARAIAGLHAEISTFAPGAVLVQGDTTTAFCGALAAFYCRVKVAHVEAGLRTGRKDAPFPEEVNRALISQIADWHFAPTARARDTLLAGGIDPASVFLTGNTVVDALVWMRHHVQQHPPAIADTMSAALAGRDLVMVTGHRRESFGAPLEQVCEAIRDVADARPDVVVIYPVHLNPSVQEPVSRILGQHPRIILLPPLPYDAFVWLMDRAAVILTDSGGVQEEAPVLGTPVLVTREVTERPEGVEAGHARLVGTDRATIVSAITGVLDDPRQRAAMGVCASPYGDGRAAERIVEILRRACNEAAM